MSFMKLLCETYDVSSLINVQTCYKNPGKSSCIYLLLTNSLQSSSPIVDTGLSDFHKMTVTVRKITFKKT